MVIMWDQVQQICDPKGRIQKIDLIKSMLIKRGPQLEAEAGFTPQNSEELIRALEDAFGYIANSSVQTIRLCSDN